MLEKCIEISFCTKVNDTIVNDKFYISKSDIEMLFISKDEVELLTRYARFKDHIENL